MGEANLAFQQNTTSAAAMSNRLHPSVCKKYIVASFLEACHNDQFHHWWMTADTWSDLIFHHSKVDPSLRYSGKDLVKVLSSKSNQLLTNQMDVDVNNVPRNHIGIFRQRFNPKNGSRTHCFYAMPIGCKPKIKLDTKWYLEILNASDLLERVITRRSTLNFSDETRQLEPPKTTPPTKKRKASELLTASDSSINDEIAYLSSSLAMPPASHSSSPSLPSSPSSPSAPSSATKSKSKINPMLPHPIESISYWD